MQFFGDKYGDSVRVVQVGGKAGSLDGWSMELCAGTHVRRTGEIGLFRITGENAIAAGVRRIEALAGLSAYERARADGELLRSLAASTNTPVVDLLKRLEQIMEQSAALEKRLRAHRDREASQLADSLAARAAERGGLKYVVAQVPGLESPNELRDLGAKV
ncbi:MAG: alanine--tRNA ligase, partial [Verrucomicrobiota bacterium]